MFSFFLKFRHSFDFVNHSYDYRPNWTLLVRITIINEGDNVVMQIQKHKFLSKKRSSSESLESKATAVTMAHQKKGKSVNCPN